MATTKLHAIKTTPVRALAYITNAGKTEDGRFLFSNGCSLDADEAAQDFLSVQQSMGTGRSSILAQHMIQSFKPGEVTPEQAFEIGRELCEKFLGDAYQYILAVHTDKQHIHCHVVFNNTNMENGKTFETLENRKKDSWKNLRALSDTICEEHRFSVIPEVEAEKGKGKSHYEWDMNRQGLSWKTQLKFALDDCIMESDSFEDFLQRVREKEIEVDYNPEHKIDLKFRMKGQSRWSRARTIGWYYETPQLKKRIAQFQLFRNGESSKQRTSVIDTTQERFQNAKGLSNWANIQNMKNASEMINLLTNMDVNSTEEIESRSISNFQKRMTLVKQLNEIQHEIDATSDALKSLRQYKRYKPIHNEYKTQKSERQKKKYAEAHLSELQKYKTALDALKKLYPDGNVPSEKEFTQKLQELMEKRNSYNQEYKVVSQQIKDLDRARQTITDYLNLGKKDPTRKEETLA